MSKTIAAFNLTPEAQDILEALGPLISYQQAAKITTASVRTLKRETAEGRLPCFRIGKSRTLRVRTVDVLALIEQVA